MIGVGGMIGGGIFSVLGLAVDVSGHSAPFAFLIGSVIASVAGYSYVRLAPRVFSFRNRTKVPAVAAIVITGLSITLASLESLKVIASF
ncbi:hypothetical protein KAH55_05960 [bacterium]|nr:hypothetical protein [bacterium]